MEVHQQRAALLVRRELDGDLFSVFSEEETATLRGGAEGILVRDLKVAIAEKWEAMGCAAEVDWECVQVLAREAIAVEIAAIAPAEVDPDSSDGQKTTLGDGVRIPVHYFAADGRGDDVVDEVSFFVKHFDAFTSRSQLQAACSVALESMSPGADAAAQKAMDEVEAKHGPLRIWDVSGVEDLSHLFHALGPPFPRSGPPEACHHFLRQSFNPDLSGWKTRGVKSMSSMFKSCEGFTGFGLNNWDVSSVEKLTNMFQGCCKFRAPLDRWSPSKCRDMCQMFRVEGEINMFADCWGVNQANRFDFKNTGRVIHMSGMFSGEEMRMRDFPGRTEMVLATSVGAAASGADVFSFSSTLAAEAEASAGPPSDYVVRRKPVLIALLILQAITSCTRVYEHGCVLDGKDPLGACFCFLGVGLGCLALARALHLQFIMYWGLFAFYLGIIETLKVVQISVLMSRAPRVAERAFLSGKRSWEQNLVGGLYLACPASFFCGAVLAWKFYHNYNGEAAELVCGERGHSLFSPRTSYGGILSRDADGLYTGTVEDDHVGASPLNLRMRGAGTGNGEINVRRLPAGSQSRGAPENKLLPGGYTAFGGVGQRIASSSSSSSDAGTWSDPGSQEEGSRHVRSSSNGQLQEHGSSLSSTARPSSSTTMNKDKRKHDKQMQKASGSHSVNIKNRESDWLRT
eukprot:g10207.t1